MFHSSVFFRLFPLALAAAFSLSSCRPEVKEEPIPAGILPDSTMVQVLANLHLADAAVNIRGTNADSAKVLRAQYHAMVFSSAGVEQKKFNESFDYYLTHPKQLGVIYEEVLNELNRKVSEGGKK